MSAAANSDEKLISEDTPAVSPAIPVLDGRPYEVLTHSSFPIGYDRLTGWKYSRLDRRRPFIYHLPDNLGTIQTHNISKNGEVKSFIYRNESKKEEFILKQATSTIFFHSFTVKKQEYKICFYPNEFDHDRERHIFSRYHWDGKIPMKLMVFTDGTYRDSVNFYWHKFRYEPRTVRKPLSLFDKILTAISDIMFV